MNGDNGNGEEGEEWNELNGWNVNESEREINKKDTISMFFFFHCLFIAFYWCLLFLLFKTQ